MTIYQLKDGDRVVAEGPAPFRYDDLAGAWDGQDHVVDDRPRALTQAKCATRMTPIRFKAQFPVRAQVAIKRARAYVDGADADPAANERKAYARDVLDILFGSLDDPRLAEVDVADPAVIGGVDFVRSLDFITADEADTIKRGVEILAP